MLIGLHHPFWVVNLRRRFNFCNRRELYQTQTSVVPLCEDLYLISLGPLGPGLDDRRSERFDPAEIASRLAGPAKEQPELTPSEDTYASNFTFHCPVASGT